jgi:uncharacterized membrane protein YkvA (DUF1232 family)
MSVPAHSPSTRRDAARANDAREQLRRVGWFRALARYYRDPSASILGKLVALVAALYAVLPFDLVPDVPIIGWLDDLGVMGLASAWLFHAVGRYREAPARSSVVGEHTREA